MFNVDKYAMPIMHLIEQRVLYHIGMIDLETAGDSNPQASIKAFANEYASVNNAKECFDIHQASESSIWRWLK